MRTIAFVILQAVVIGWWLYVDWDSSRTLGTESRPGVALAMGVFFAAIVSAGAARLIDAWRYGWKASEPRGAMRSALSWTSFALGIVVAMYGVAITFGVGNSAETFWQGVSFIAAGAALTLLPLVLWIISRIRSPQVLPDRDRDPSGLALPPATGREIDQASRERGELTAAGRGGDQLPKPLRRLG